MEINDHTQYLERRILKSVKHRDEALSKSALDLAALNMKGCFMHNFELGLIRWRMGQNPVAHMQEALEGLLQGWEALLSLGATSEDVAVLPFFCSVYLASLLKRPHPAIDLRDFAETMVPGVFLGKVLTGTDSIENWPQHQNKLPNEKRTALARASFDLYADLLSRKVTASEGVKRGEIYYKRREDDPYYGDSPALFGGSHLNDRFVDFRLGAVLKHIGSTVPSIHAWRW